MVIFTMGYFSYRLIENAVNRGVNDSEWIECPPTPDDDDDDMLYKENSIYYSIIQVYSVTTMVCGVIVFTCCVNSNII